jgi:prepilin-type N-terminal cleavage/methylation domain-containing protein
MYRQFEMKIDRRGFRAQHFVWTQGFTLVEVLAVVCILGIASAVILPQVANRDDTNTASAARTVMADLLYAQNRAISTQSMQYVSFDVSAQEYGLYCSMSPTPVALTHPVNRNNYIMTFANTGTNNISSEVALTSVNFNGSSVLAFDEEGVPYSYASGTATALTGTGSIVLTCGTYSLTVFVSQDTGEISVN